MWIVDKIKLQILRLPIIVAAMALLSCEAEEQTLTLGPLVVDSTTSDAIHCSVEVAGGIPIDYGFYYATSKDAAEKITAPKVKGTYDLIQVNASLEGLESNTTYYIRAYAMNMRGRVYTETIEAKTLTRMPEANDNQYPDIEF
ncbi:MAG: fibronectin type III domain-containing protein [Bacteroidaceae bacterium]|nr:fibronectin type III domain-containing protein [Bacteroidaceae bacterium]